MGTGELILKIPVLAINFDMPFILPVAHPSKFQNMHCNTSLQPQNPNLSNSEKKKKFFFKGIIKKKTKIKKPPETFYGVAFLICKMAQIRSQRKKNFFGHFSGRPKFYLKLRLGSSNAVWMFILPTVHPFLRLNLSYDTSPERTIHNLEDWLLRIGKIILYKRVLRIQNS